MNDTLQESETARKREDFPNNLCLSTGRYFGVYVGSE